MLGVEEYFNHKTLYCQKRNKIQSKKCEPYNVSENSWHFVLEAILHGTLSRI